MEHLSRRRTNNSFRIHWPACSPPELPQIALRSVNLRRDGDKFILYEQFVRIAREFAVFGTRFTSTAVRKSFSGCEWEIFFSTGRLAPLKITSPPTFVAYNNFRKHLSTSLDVQSPARTDKFVRCNRTPFKAFWTLPRSRRPHPRSRSLPARICRPPVNPSCRLPRRKLPHTLRHLAPGPTCMKSSRKMKSQGAPSIRTTPKLLSQIREGRSDGDGALAVARLEGGANVVSRANVQETGWENSSRSSVPFCRASCRRRRHNYSNLA